MCVSCTEFNNLSNASVYDLLPLFVKKLEQYKQTFRESKLGKKMAKKSLETTEPRLLRKALRKHAKNYASSHRCSRGAHQILVTI